MLGCLSFFVYSYDSVKLLNRKEIMPNTGNITNFLKLEIYELKKEPTTSTTTLLDLCNSLLHFISYLSAHRWVKLQPVPTEASLCSKGRTSQKTPTRPNSSSQFSHLWNKKSITLNSRKAFPDHDSEAMLTYGRSFFENPEILFYRCLVCVDSWYCFPYWKCLCTYKITAWHCSQEKK